MSLVLLVRPHDFIVEEMQFFLKKAGFQPRRISTLDELPGIPEYAVSGAVISTAVTSVIPQSFAEVLRRVRLVFPKLPLAAATLAPDFTKGAALVRGELDEKDQNIEITPLGHAPATGRGTGAGRLLLLRRDDLLAPTPGSLDALRGHFRPAVPVPT